MHGLHPRLIRPLSRDGNIPWAEALVAISLGFDGTKVPQHLQVSYPHKAIVGGFCPNHFIDISRVSKEEVKDLLDLNSSVVRAKDHQKLKPTMLQCHFLGTLSRVYISRS